MRNERARPPEGGYYSLCHEYRGQICYADGLSCYASTHGAGTARQRGMTSLMPREEAEKNNALYFYAQKVNDVQYDGARAIIDARRVDPSEFDPSHPSPAHVAGEIELTQAALSERFLRSQPLQNLSLRPLRIFHPPLQRKNWAGFALRRTCRPPTCSVQHEPFRWNV